MPHRDKRRWLRRTLGTALSCALLALMLSAPAAHPARAAAGNLLSDAGFEQGTAWARCGTAEIVQLGQPGVTAAMVYGGQRALRLTYGETGTCGSPVFDPHGAATQAVTIPADAQDVTISFWYSRVGNPVWGLSVSLAEDGGFGYLATVTTDNLPGWQQFRLQLTAQQLDQVRGKTVLLELASKYDPASPGAPAADMPGFYIDDVRVVAALERTGESSRPPDLRSDGTAPIVYLDAQLGGIARLDADGSGRRPLYASPVTPFSPAWSSGGRQIAVLQGSLNPESTTDPTVNPAQISRVVVVDAQSGAAREIYRTAGLPGVKPPAPTPGNPERPALDVIASSVTWSPDDRQIAVAVCASNRRANGSTTDPSCWVDLIEIATGTSRAKLEPAFAPRWSQQNRVVYANNDSYRADQQGILEADLSGGSLVKRVLVPGMGALAKPASYTDSQPAWSPDGAQFVTIRNVSGFHYNDAGQYTVHYAIMRFTRGDPLGRQLLLVDQGTPGNLTWSPDGKFILYTCYQGQRADLWWLDTRDGATGRLTTSGVAAAADWRQRTPAALRPWAFLPLVKRG